MFSLFTSSKDRKLSAPRKSVVEAPKTARPWPFLAASPPVQRAPPRHSLSMPQHVAIFSDTANGTAGLSGNNSHYTSFMRNMSISSVTSAESSPGANSPTRQQFFRGDDMTAFTGAAPSTSESGIVNSGAGVLAEEYRNDKRQLRTSMVPDLF